MPDPLSGAVLAVVGSLVDGLVQHLVGRGAERVADQREIRRLLDVDQRVRTATRELEGFRRAELQALTDEQWAAAGAEAIQALRAVPWATQDAVVFVDVDRLVRAVGVPDMPSSDAEAARRAILTVCCTQFAAGARTSEVVLRRLELQTFLRFHDELDQRSDEHDRFTERYLALVGREIATFEMFQVTQGRSPVGQPFADFYAMPALTRRETEQTGDMTGIGTSAASAITDVRRVALLGGAGAGKTTFLRWLAHVSATGDPGAPWPDAVPFFLSLRRFAGHRAASSTGDLLPRPDELLAHTAPMLTGGAPSGWANAVFDQGRALLLVDGMDELVTAERAEATTWLRTLMAAYPDAHYVVSTRPSAVDQYWMSGTDGLARFELLSLSANGLSDVIRRWYGAARALERDPEQTTWLTGCEERLLANLVTRPRLRTLVGSPLLCSLLCALYRRGNISLPRNHRELLEAALRLLLVDWDETRRIRTEDGVKLSMEEQLVLLQRFAASLVREQELLVTREVAEGRIASAMRGLRSAAADPHELLQQILERTGLLREHVDDGSVQFVHRTFRDYLAASEILDARETSSLLRHASDDGWSEVVFMAIAQARPRERAVLLGELLWLADKAKDKDQERRYELIAAAGLDYADVVDPDTVREDVEQAVRRHIPPTTDWDAELLAKAGDFVLNLLPKPADLAEQTKEQAQLTVLTAALIGGTQAGELIQLYAATVDVVNPLLRAWREADFTETYAAEVLAEVDFGDLMLPVRRFEVLERCRLLTKLRGVHLIGRINPLRPLALLKGLQRLHISDNEQATKLAPLSACRSLTSLRLSGLNAVRDLSPLADSTITDLAIAPQTGSPGPDLSTLAGAHIETLEIRHDALRSSLRPLPADLPLRELVLLNRPGRRGLDGLDGVDRWPGLRKLTLYGPVSEAERELLDILPGLEVVERTD